MTKVSLLRGKLSLSANALKVIAIIAMTIDHLAWMGITEYAQALTPIQIFLHSIGRLTAPIMFFFVAEGYHHTSNYWKYLLRMAILALVSHFAFCYFSHQSFNPFNNQLFGATSIAWPLMWGLIFLKVWDEEKINILLKILITVIGCVLTYTSDWSCTAPLSILMMGRNYNNFNKQMFWLMTIVSLYAVAFYVFKDHTYGVVHMAGLFSIPLLSLYNGQRGKLHWLGNFFYLYYPLHLTLIGIITHTFFS